MIEEWKDINGYNGKYKISNTGKVISMNYNNTRKPRELKPKINRQGYLEIKLSINNKAKDYMLARLVLEYFTDFEFNKNIIILYKDDNKKNCQLDNLFWITRGQYQEFTYDKGNRKRNMIEYNGKKMAIKDLPRDYNLENDLIYERLRAGWCVEEAILIPKEVRK